MKFLIFIFSFLFFLSAIAEDSELKDSAFEDSELESSTLESSELEDSESDRTPQQSSSEELTEDGYKKIRHPLGKRGLRLITKDQVYHYNVKKSPQKNATSVVFGTYAPTALGNQSISYSDIYDNGFMLTMDYEWQFFKSFGKMGYKLGSGLMVANGTGVLVNSSGVVQGTAREKYTFIMMPNHALLVYRAQFWDSQPIVPYAEAGGGYYTFGELRDDGDSPKYGGSLTLEWAVGAALNLGGLNPQGLLTLDREYGINSVWLTGEFRSIIGLKEELDLSAEIINVGFLVEF